MVSFFLHQLAMCFHITNTLEDTQEFEAFNDNHTIKVNVEDSNPQHEKEQRPTNPKARAWDNAMKGLKDVTDDWRWQRVFGQVAILVLMSTYLALVDDDAGSSIDNLASIVLATMVAVNIWCATFTVMKAFHALCILWLMLLTSTIGERLGISRIKSFCVSPPIEC
jgi:hypothetical protein